jgi:hypothetical protein
LYVKTSKFSFGKQELEYLSHIVSWEGVKVNPPNIQDITKCPIPKNIKGLRGFLGLIGYYLNFVKNYAHIVGSLTSLLNKISFVWNEEATLEFSLLKDCMSSTPIFSTLDFGKTFIVECDALGQGTRVVLMQ